MLVLDLTGKTFARLTVLRQAPYQPGCNNAFWHCRCSCNGVEILVRGAYLVNGHTKSCGCLRREQRQTHGLYKSLEYNSWHQMLQRCTNPSNHKYASYAGRGITVDPRWHDFATFYADVGPRPSPKHSLDRIDNNGNYEPGNVKWSTRLEQQNNMRSNVFVEYLGQRMTLAQAARAAIRVRRGRATTAPVA